MINFAGPIFLPLRVWVWTKTTVLVLLIFTPPFLQARDVPLPDPKTLKRLRQGEIVAEPIELHEKGGAVKVSMMFWAPVEDIWATVYSCGNAFIFLAGLEICEVLEDNGVDTVTRKVVNKGWPVPRQEYSFRTHRVPYTHADIQLVEGDLKSMVASWDYINMPEAVIVVHKVRLQPGFPAPRFLVRRNLSRGMTRLLACVRGLAGGSGSPERKKRDLDRCPGKISRTSQ